MIVRSTFINLDHLKSNMSLLLFLPVMVLFIHLTQQYLKHISLHVDLVLHLVKLIGNFNDLILDE